MLIGLTTWSAQCTLCVVHGVTLTAMLVWPPETVGTSVTAMLVPAPAVCPVSVMVAAALGLVMVVVPFAS